MFSCEYYEIFKNSFFIEYLWCMLLYRDIRTLSIDVILVSLLVTSQIIQHINLFHATDLFLYPKKTSASDRKPLVFWCFQGASEETSGIKVIDLKFPSHFYAFKVDSEETIMMSSTSYFCRAPQITRKQLKKDVILLLLCWLIFIQCITQSIMVVLFLLIFNIHLLAKVIRLGKN